METSPRISPSTSPDQELLYIRKIINDSRRSFSEDGKPYIVWGLLVAIGMTVTYISALIQRDLYTGYIWIGLVLIGYVYIAYMVKNKRAKERAQNFVDR